METMSNVMAMERIQWARDQLWLFMLIVVWCRLSLTMDYGHVWSHALNRLAHDHKKFFSSGYTTFIASLHTIVNYRISLKYSCVNSKFQSSQYKINWCSCKHASHHQSMMPNHPWPSSLVFFLHSLLIQAIEHDNTFITTNNDCPSSRVRLVLPLSFQSNLVYGELPTTIVRKGQSTSDTERKIRHNRQLKNGKKGDDATGDVKKGT